MTSGFVDRIVNIDDMYRVFFSSFLSSFLVCLVCLAILLCVQLLSGIFVIEPHTKLRHRVR